MSFRRKLLLLFAVTVAVSVIAVAWAVSAVTRRAFERVNADRTTALVAQFRREFARRGEDIAGRVQIVAGSDESTRMAMATSRGSPDYGAYLNHARALVEAQHLDFLEFLDSDGVIISSAQWPAKFGYKDTSLPNPAAVTDQTAFLKQEELPEATALGMFAVRAVEVGDKPLYAVGGERLDRNFLASLELPAGMRALLYQNVEPGFRPALLIDPSGTVQGAGTLAPLIQIVQQHGQEATQTVHWSADPADDETLHAIPLTGENNRVLGVLLLGTSQRPYVELGRRIRWAALLVGGAGIALAILLSGWAAARVTRPIEQLAQAAREVAAGNWDAQVEATSRDELGELAESFNRMTGELLEQKERLVQAERVAAWRELARRLAHELKNPLFPLQLTVENLARARQQTPDQFDEIFQESSATLLAEIANLKAIVGRFSEFSRMPSPRFQKVQLNELVQGVARLFQAQARADAGIECKLELTEKMEPIAADAELLHRAFSNLVLNALDAMPQGGTLTLRTRQHDDRAYVEVSDTGVGLTAEECVRLFTPYYTSKQHGTGLGLAIAQAVVSDHGGKISVQSQPGRGTTFLIELPRHIDKLSSAARAGTEAS